MDPELLSKIKGAWVHPGGCFNMVFVILGLSSGGGPAQATRCFQRPDDPSRWMVNVVRPDALAREIEIEILTSSLPSFASPPRSGRRPRSRQVARWGSVRGHPRQHGRRALPQPPLSPRPPHHQRGKRCRAWQLYAPAAQELKCL